MQKQVHQQVQQQQKVQQQQRAHQQFQKRNLQDWHQIQSSSVVKGINWLKSPSRNQMYSLKY